MRTKLILQGLKEICRSLGESLGVFRICWQPGGAGWLVMGEVVVTLVTAHLLSGVFFFFFLSGVFMDMARRHLVRSGWEAGVGRLIMIPVGMGM